jgi:hypothetical protein
MIVRNILVLMRSHISACPAYDRDGGEAKRNPPIACDRKARYASRLIRRSELILSQATSNLTPWASGSVRP